MQFFKYKISNLTLLLLILLIWFQYSLWFGKNSLYDYNRVSNEISIQQKINTKLKSLNNHLLIEINDLNIGQEEIEERARNELNMIKSGETFYRIILNLSK